MAGEAARPGEARAACVRQQVAWWGSEQVGRRVQAKKWVQVRWNRFYSDLVPINSWRNIPEWLRNRTFSLFGGKFASLSLRGDLIDNRASTQLCGKQFLAIHLCCVTVSEFGCSDNRNLLSMVTLWMHRVCSCSQWTRFQIVIVWLAPEITGYFIKLASRLLNHREHVISRTFFQVLEYYIIKFAAPDQPFASSCRRCSSYSRPAPTRDATQPRRTTKPGQQASQPTKPAPTEPAPATEPLVSQARL